MHVGKIGEHRRKGFEQAGKVFHVRVRKKNLQAVVGEEGLAGDAADVSWMNSWFVLYNNSMASMYACRHAKIQPMAPTMQFARDVDISYNTHCRVTATGEVPTSHAQASM
uniref:Uncharacterized protein n=1 Tax=Coccidioides posadasii RMSCC 3488 TaxID=454284 RepID=A0A0J6IFX7_COCPO|nr:hypothetical protein CPAG_07013 [Coccidioides posadasii RMSCC 3488]